MHLKHFISFYRVNARDKRSPEPQWGYYNSRPYYNRHPYNNNYYYGSGRGFNNGFNNANFRRGLATATLVGAAAVGGGLLGAGLAAQG